MINKPFLAFKNQSNITRILSLAGLLVFLATLFLGKAGIPFILFCTALLVIGFSLFEWDDQWLSPALFMIVSPVLLIQYSSITDFRIRSFCFLLLAWIFGLLFSKGPNTLKSSLTKSRSLSIWLMALLILGLSATALYIQDINLSGDEPHYIMISQSLVDDGDFDLKNNMEEKTYFSYLPIELRFHGGNYNGKYHSFHMPGLSFLLIPFYWLFNLLGGAVPAALFFRLVAALFNAFFALALFRVLKIIFPEEEIGSYWLLLLFIFPLVSHGVHLYPELPGATLLMAGFIFAFSENPKYLWSGLALALIPWFHIKYIPGLVVLALAITYRIFKEKKVKSFIQFFVFPALSFILLLIYVKLLYGSINPADVFPKEGYFTVPILARVRTFLAYFLDQRDGLLFYSPLFFLAFFGLGQKFKHRGVLLGVAAAYILAHANTTVRGAYSPAGRPLMFVSWILIVFVINYLLQLKKSRQIQPGLKERLPAIPLVLTGFSLLVTVFIFYYPLFVYQPVTRLTTERASGFLTFMGSTNLDLSSLFPSFLSISNWGYTANYVWLIILLAALAYHYLPLFKNRPQLLKGIPKKVTAILVFLATCFLFCYWPHIHLLAKNKFIKKEFSFYNNSRNFYYTGDRDLFRIKAGNNYDIYFDPRVGPGRIQFHFQNSRDFAITVRNTNNTLLKTRDRQDARVTFSLKQLKTTSVKNKPVIHIGIETKALNPDAPFLYLKISPQ